MREAVAPPAAGSILDAHGDHDPFRDIGRWWPT
jgi:hypothetical protein